MEKPHSSVGADVLASGIHDAKNRLFEAQTLLAQAEREQGIRLPDARLAITGAAGRLSRTLVAYRLMRDQQPIAVMPVPVVELVEDAALTVGSQFERAGITLALDARWPGLEGRLSEAVDRLARDGALRTGLSARSAELCDGQGAQRAADALIAALAR